MPTPSTDKDQHQAHAARSRWAKLDKSQRSKIAMARAEERWKEHNEIIDELLSAYYDEQPLLNWLNTQKPYQWANERMRCKLHSALLRRLFLGPR